MPFTILSREAYEKCLDSQIEAVLANDFNKFREINGSVRDTRSHIGCWRTAAQDSLFNFVYNDNCISLCPSQLETCDNTYLKTLKVKSLRDVILLGSTHSLKHVTCDKETLKFTREDLLEFKRRQLVAYDLRNPPALAKEKGLLGLLKSYIAAESKFENARKEFEETRKKYIAELIRLGYAQEQAEQILSA